MDIFEKHRTLFLVEGIIFIILGLIAIALPQLTTLAVELFIGWLFLIGGIIQIIRTITSKNIPGFWPSLIGSLFSIVIGILLLAFPLPGILSLTLLLTIYFFADGIAKIILSFEYRPIPNWGWLTVSGIISLILALIIWSGWPSTAAFIIGLLVGINMLFFGFTFISLLSLTKPKKDKG
jgi:uncharacterized membrane protein HdeD (DUF308 family)